MSFCSSLYVRKSLSSAPKKFGQNIRMAHTLMVKDQGFDPEACISSPYGLGDTNMLFLSTLILALGHLQTSKSVPNLGILRFDIGLTDQQLSDIQPLDCSTLWMLVLYLVGSLCFWECKTSDYLRTTLAAYYGSGVVYSDSSMPIVYKRRATVA